MTDDNFRRGHTAEDFLEAMANAPSRPVNAENPIPGLVGHDEYLIPQLWSLDLRTRMPPDMAAAVDQSTREFLTDLYGPWED
jgi:hypothetical protein